MRVLEHASLETLSYSYHIPHNWAQILNVKLNLEMTRGKLINFSVPQFHIFKMGMMKKFIHRIVLRIKYNNACNELKIWRKPHLYLTEII